MSLQQLLATWKNTPQIAENIVIWKTIPPRRGQVTGFPADLHPELAAALHTQGISALYTHQSQAWQRARKGEHLVVVTGTASGKTLCYNLPILDRLLQAPEARALYIFPTKALAQDQLSQIHLTSPQTPAATYDGDTPGSQRPRVRQNARLVISNPDMLHLGVLPFHTRWAHFFRHLQFIVLDEIHTYRGVFGSHVANVIRRIKRVAAFYGAFPQFIMTSATIGNPVELAEKLIESPVTLIGQDGSARGRQHFLIYNPPVVNQELGIRRGVLQESVYLAGDLLAYQVQALVFARSRRSVELTLRYLRASPAPGLSEGQGEAPLRAYRSGYLPAQRREIERGLRDGSVRAVAATNALELGVDIGGMGAVVLAGYPGSIAATWQQAGRAGRGREESLAVLLTSANPLDQFLAQHPEYFFARSPEKALINPDNLLILLNHLRCAAYELPFQAQEGFGGLPAQRLQEFLDFLAQSGELHASRDKYFWTAEQSPASDISLRNASPNRILLRSEIEGQPLTIGEVDRESALWMAHPGAIYLHQAESYLVDKLNLEDGIASLHPVETDYYTETLQDTEVSLVEKLAENPVPGGSTTHGEIRVITQVTGYRKIQWQTQERLATEPLDLPPTELHTMGYWLALSDETVGRLREAGLWGSDPNRYGPGWPNQRDAARARDGYRCQSCGAPETSRAHDVHHKTPFRAFPSAQQANRLENLVTLCPACHRRAESVVRIRSGLSGLGFVLGHLSPLFLMCDHRDLGVHSDPKSPLADGKPAIVIYDRVPAGIGFSQQLFEIHSDLMRAALERVDTCPCQDGCPSCVGPGGESGTGGKAETRALLVELVKGQSEISYNAVP